MENDKKDENIAETTDGEDADLNILQRFKRFERVT